LALRAARRRVLRVDLHVPHARDHPGLRGALPDVPGLTSPAGPSGRHAARALPDLPDPARGAAHRRERLAVRPGPAGADVDPLVPAGPPRLAPAHATDPGVAVPARVRGRGLA